MFCFSRFGAQIDFLDSQTQLSLEQFQRDWDLARYGDGTFPAENEEFVEADSGTKKRPLSGDGVVAGKKKTASLAQKKPKKGHAPANRAALPPLRDHPFGDLTRFAPPPKNPASSFMQFSRKFRAGKERGKAPNARSVSETWNQMSEDEKRPFVDLAEEDKKRVQVEIDHYIAQVC